MLKFGFFVDGLHSLLGSFETAGKSNGRLDLSLIVCNLLPGEIRTVHKIIDV